MCGILFYDLSVEGQTVDKPEVDIVFGLDIENDHNEGVITDLTSDLEVIRCASNSIAHRGPDGSSFSIIESSRGGRVMGFHRLAVINHKSPSGMQPMQSDNGASLVCNGEIYNYCELARSLNVDVSRLGSDVHILLHVLEPASDVASVCRSLDEVDGEFAFVVSDSKMDRIVVARDPWGVRPLFFARNNLDKIVAFASEAKALISLPNVKNVEVFPPGHVMISIGGQEYVSAQYHTPKLDSSPVARNGCGDISHIRSLVETAIRKRIDHSDRSVGVLCSGGLDSAIVTSLVAADQALREKIRVFTVKYDSGHSDDAFYAQLLASQCGINVEVCTFNLSDVLSAIAPVIKACETCDPNTIRAAVPMYLLARHISRNTDIKVILSGEGADELFCGYSYQRLAKDGLDLNSESHRLLKQLHMFDLLRADRCFAAFGLEVRVPYLDLNLVDYVLQLPGEEKMITPKTNYVEKRLLRDAFRDASTPIGSLLEKSKIIDRPKEKLSDGCGFSYIPHLLSHIGKDLTTLESRLHAESEYYKGIFDDFYGEHNRSLVSPRIMPIWAGGKDSVGAVMDS